MQNEELLKTISTPGSVAVALIWLHFRLLRIENNQRVIAQAMQVRMPERKAMLGMMGTVLVVLWLMLSSGCAVAVHTSTVGGKTVTTWN